MRSGGTGGNELSTDNQSNKHAQAKRADDTFGGVLANIILSCDVEFLGQYASVPPLLSGAFLQALCPLGGRLGRGALSWQ